MTLFCHSSLGLAVPKPGGADSQRTKMHAAGFVRVNNCGRLRPKRRSAIVGKLAQIPAISAVRIMMDNTR
jgi:hypothetical protein